MAYGSGGLRGGGGRCGRARSAGSGRGVGARAVVQIHTDAALVDVASVLLDGGRGPATEGRVVAEAARR